MYVFKIVKNYEKYYYLKLYYIKIITLLYYYYYLCIYNHKCNY